MINEEQNPAAEHPDWEKSSSSDDTEQIDSQDEDRKESAETPSSEEGVSELKDKYLRLFAEFDNFKKRTIRERLDLMKSASQDMMSALLPVLDDFDRAVKNAGDKDYSEDPVMEGLFLVHHKLQAILKTKGLEEMHSTGEPFDPEMHEAITEIPSPLPEMKGKVIDTVEKGYRLNDKIIRYAKVVVGS